MAALKRVISRAYGDKCWAVLGPNGAVDWGLATDSCLSRFRPVGVHSPYPQETATCHGPLNDCPHLEVACFLDCLFLAGENLGEAWEAAGRDDRIIWDELERWYEARLAGLVAEARGR